MNRYTFNNQIYGLNGSSLSCIILFEMISATWIGAMQNCKPCCNTFNQSQNGFYWYDYPGNVQLGSLQSTFCNPQYFDCTRPGNYVAIDITTNPKNGWTTPNCDATGQNGLCELGKIEYEIKINS